MPCYRPITAYQFHTGLPEHTHSSGKSRLFFNVDPAKVKVDYLAYHEVLTLPCGRCVGCKSRKVQDWSLRCEHEVQNWERSSFLTLTYKTSSLPSGRSLDKTHPQSFFKRLRQELKRKHGVSRIKYYMAGEYGEKKGRPHYHVVLFGWDFPDRYRVGNNPGARDPLYQSPALDRLWSHGECKIGEVNAATAAYVARYTLKKLRSIEADREYRWQGKVAPYMACSKGIGKDHLVRYADDYYPSDYAIDPSTRQRRPLPRYYDKVVAKTHPRVIENVKLERQARAAKANQSDRTPERLRDREEVHGRKIGLILNRPLEANHASEDSGQRA